MSRCPSTADPSSVRFHQITALSSASHLEGPKHLGGGCLKVLWVGEHGLEWYVDCGWLDGSVLGRDGVPCQLLTAKQYLGTCVRN